MKRYLIPMIMLLILAAPVTAKAAQTDRVCIDTNVYYDTAENCYIYVIENLGNVEIQSSVASGMYTNGPVSLKYNNTLNVTVFKDGVQLEASDYSEISEPGSYVVQLMGSGVSSSVLNFTIVGELGAFSKYVMPKGFSIMGLYKDGEEVETNGSVAEFGEEGFYLVDYMNIETGVTYSLRVTVDKTPPTLALEGVVDGVAKQGVSLRDKEEGATLYIEQDGVSINPPAVLEETGKYYVKITDAAGNYSEYSFEIRVGINGMTLLFVIVFIIMVIALGVYLFVERTKMRVR